jgi:Na+-translocating ferredoxin:NAD+ oxidoreductase RnfA subunit
LQNIIFILVIAALVQMLELFLKKFIPALHKGMGVYLPLITTNCAVLGVTINNIIDGYNFLESMVSSLGVGIGFLQVIWVRQLSEDGYGNTPQLVLVGAMMLCGALFLIIELLLERKLRK